MSVSLHLLDLQAHAHNQEPMAGMAQASGMSISGTFQGHVLPGVLFLIWAGWWTYELLSSRGALAYEAGLLERSLVMPWMKILLPVIGVFGELAPGRFEWRDAMVNNYQHAVMYVGFIIAGVVDLLARKGRMSRSGPYLAYAGAFLNAALLFAGHGHMGGLADTVHQLLVVLFVASAALALIEIRLPDRGIAWFRIGVMYALGFWLIEIAWLLYRSGYDLMDHHSQMKAYLFFSATTFGVGLALLVVHQVLGGSPLAGGRAPEGVADGIGAG